MTKPTTPYSMNRLRLGTHTEYQKICTELNRKIARSLSQETIEFIQQAGLDLQKIYRSKRKWFVCRTCTSIFGIFPAEIRKKPETAGMYCTVSCRQKQVIKRLHASGKHIHPMSEEQKQRQRESMQGELNRAWKGGVTYFRKKGNYGKFKIKYVRCPKEYLAMSRKDGYVMEHRLLVAMQVERPLTRMESVHHIDHNPENNSLDNLMLFSTNADHKKYEHGQNIQPLWQLSAPSITTE